jgi:EamA-like transporter family
VLPRQRTPDNAGTVAEPTGVRPGVVEPDERAGRLGRKPLRAGRDQYALGFAVASQPVEVGRVGQTRPQVRATQVSQVQLVQPVLSIGWAALLLREQLTWSTVLGGVAVIASAGLAVRLRAQRTPQRNMSVVDSSY